MAAYDPVFVEEWTYAHTGEVVICTYSTDGYGNADPDPFVTRGYDDRR